ncbi:MAG TPA: Ku protein [Solirubrobacteraceae bacterium]|nr:Ku protein [Solirubrobacteraceae bacterium]
MARSLWNGTIVFGAVAVPVKLHTAIDAGGVHFREVHISDGSRIEHRRFCSKEDHEVPRDEVVRGYEVRAGEYVVVDKEEVDAAGGDHGRIIDVQHVVDVSQIDPIHYDRPYFLGAGEGGVDAYRLLHDALQRTGRAAIGRFTFHNREYLAVIAARGDVLVLHTLRFADELVGADELDLPDAGRKPDEREVAMARQLVESLHEDFDASRYRDEYRELVMRAIEAKAEGRRLPSEKPEQRTNDDDLLAALQASLKA